MTTDSPESVRDKTEAYAAFAYAYDRALGFRFHQAVRRLLEDADRAYPPAEKTHLDVACGTGLAVHAYRVSGWQSTGVDASLPMLQVARTRASRFVAGDYRALPFRGTFARITCLYDSLNHLRDRIELAAAFRSMSRLMGRDSLLLFDMNHPDIYPEVWGNPEPYVSADDTYHLEIATSFSKREGIARALVSGWARPPGSCERVEIHETHEQRSYTQRQIVAALGDANLRPIDIIDFDPYGEADVAGPIKLFFICRRK